MTRPLFPILPSTTPRPVLHRLRSLFSRPLPAPPADGESAPSAPPPAAEAAAPAPRPERPPPGSPEAWDHAEEALREVTEMAIWDYVCMEEPRPGEEGSEAVLGLAGSTSLDYYRLVHVRFHGVRYSSCPRYFHHPLFGMATPDEEWRLRGLCTFGEHSFAVRVVRDHSSPLEETAYVVCDGVEVEHLEGAERMGPYRPVHRENAGWWE